MKKLLSFLMAAVLLCSVLILSGCGKETTSDEKKGSKTSDGSSLIKDAALPVFKTDTTIEETVIYEKDGVKIIANAIEFENDEMVIDFTFENNTGKNISIVSGSIGYSCNAVNKCMITGAYINSDITAGAKAVEEMVIDLIELQMYGITEVSEIEVGFAISDGNNNEVYTGPLSIKTSANDYDSSEINFINSIQNKELQDGMGYSVEYVSEDKVFDNASVSVTSESFVTTSDGERMLLMELNNTSDSQLIFCTQKISVNGIKLYETLWSSYKINAGSKGIEEITIDDVVDKEILEKYGIKDISSISVYGSVKDAKGNSVVKPTEFNITVSSKESKADVSGTEVYNSNNIKIISKGFWQSGDEYDDDIHLLLLVQNDSADEINVESEYDTLTLNSIMTDNTSDDCTVSPSSYGIMDIEIGSYDYEDTGITGVKDIKTATLEFKITTSSGKEIDSPKITVNS